MKQFFSLFAFTFLFFNLSGQYCDKNSAEIIAQNTISERFHAISKSSQSYQIKSSYTHYHNSYEVFHVFNIMPQGFIIISADKSTVPVLAFSTESDFIFDELNPAVKMWTTNYAEQIIYSIENPSFVSQKTESEWSRLSMEKESFINKSGIKTIQPMLTTKWDQGRYYNAHCPQDPAGTDGRVVVGCVATALGQLMNYFRYPQTGVGSYGYEHPEYGWIEVDFSDQNYDYDYMPVSPSDYNDNLARLLYNIGVSVDMNYGPNGSGMWNHKGAYTLRTFFGYNPDTRYYFRDSLPEDFDWIGNLVSHLEQGIPLYYAGWADYDFISGHAFILDGFSDSTHYHINWGWGGSADGYFYIENLRPGGNNFTLLHEVISYATPNSEPSYCNELKTIQSNEGVIDDGSGPLANYQNNYECSWLINPIDSVSGIRLEFLKLKMDNEDYIVIFDGHNESAPVIATIYGGDIPQILTSTSEKVLVKFVTNADSVNDGWLLKFSGIKPVYCQLSSNLTLTTDTITDGSNSYQYHNNVLCNWTIQPAGAEDIRIRFLEFDLEPVNDYVKILNSSNQTVATLSGSEIPNPITIIGHKATVTFRTNSGVRAGGFKLVYEINVSNIDDHKNRNISIYPNPAEEKLFVKLDNFDSEVKIEVFTIDGKSISQSISNEDLTEISLSNLSNGIYFIEIKGASFLERLKFIKQ
jgi:hypothetical protein